MQGRVVAAFPEWKAPTGWAKVASAATPRSPSQAGVVAAPCAAVVDTTASLWSLRDLLRRWPASVAAPFSLSDDLLLLAG